MAKRSQTLWTSEDYHEDAVAAHNSQWIIYNHEEDLDSWLEANAPSKILRSDGVGWITIRKKKAPRDEDSDESSDTDQDSDGSSDTDQVRDDDSDTDHGIAELKQDWEDLKKSGKLINFQSISELARKHGDRSSGTDQNSNRTLDIKQDSDGSSDTEQDSDGSSDTEQDSDGSSDIDKFQQDWKDLKNSGEPVNFQSISQLAKKHNIVSGGSWLFHVETGYKVDFLWSKLAKEFISGVLTDVARSIWVSSFEPIMHDLSHVILVKNSDFSNEEGIFKLENAIRLAGVKTTMRYKPEIYATLGIYRNNEFGIKPTIYSSCYDVLTKESTITQVKKAIVNN